MKKILLASVAAMAVVVLSFEPSYATVLTFGDLPGDGSAVPDGYGGFDWNNQTTVGSFNASNDPGTGHQNGAVSSPNVVYNYFGNSPVEWFFWVSACSVWV